LTGGRKGGKSKEGGRALCVASSSTGKCDMRVIIQDGRRYGGQADSAPKGKKVTGGEGRQLACGVSPLYLGKLEKDERGEIRGGNHKRTMSIGGGAQHGYVKDPGEGWGGKRFVVLIVEEKSSLRWERG